VVNSFDVVVKTAFVDRIRSWINGTSASARQIFSRSNQKQISNAVSKTIDEALKRNQQVISDTLNQAVSKTLSSDNASQLIRNTLKKTWAPLTAGAVGLGLVAGIGSGIGSRISGPRREA
jgi:uncharacterized membrane protein YheB (UPF0754 family)